MKKVKEWFMGLKKSRKIIVCVVAFFVVFSIPYIASGQYAKDKAEQDKMFQQMIKEHKEKKKAKEIEKSKEKAESERKEEKNKPIKKQDEAKSEKLKDASMVHASKKDDGLDTMRKCTVMEAADIYTTGYGAKSDNVFNDARDTCYNFLKYTYHSNNYEFDKAVDIDWKHRKSEQVDGKDLEYYLSILGW